MKLAPIVLFAYNRPKHTRQTLKALMANPLAKESDLFIYADGAKPNASTSDIEAIQDLRDYLQLLCLANKSERFFKSITLITQDKNLGLADSITQGVSEIMTRFGRAIILEDDIVTSPVFLDYMNAALARYENEPRVWSIAAWNYPIDTQGLGDCYFWRAPNCWGWASWADRWQHFKRDTKWAIENFSKEDRDYINIDGTAPSYFAQLIGNHTGRLKTWAIFNYLIAYKHKALTLCPNRPYIRQIGFDDSGVHCGSNGEKFNTDSINTKFPIVFPDEIIESTLALERIKAFELKHKTPLIIRAYRKALRILRRKLGNAILGRS